MGSSAADMLGGKLPTGTWFYSFMFGDSKTLIPEYVALGRLPAPSSLVIGMAVGVLLTAIRVLLDFAVFKPLARRILGVSGTQPCSPVPVLDALCSKHKFLSPEELTESSKCTEMSVEQVREYAKMKRVTSLQDTQLGKFKEAAWRLVVYASLVTFALKMSFGETWFRDPYLVWENWPAADHLEVLGAYYHVAMGVYWHFIVFQFWDTRRSDFWQMLIHHVATLFLLVFSWFLSLVRIGTLIMLCHDVSDVFMESAKLFNYSQKRHHWCHLAADGVFFVFAVVFGVSRLYIFPRYMVFNVWQTETLSNVARLFFCGLLVTLLVLHVFWFGLILRMVYMFVWHGVEEDIRSDNEAEGNGSANGHKGSANGHNGHKAKSVANGNGRPHGKKDA